MVYAEILAAGSGARMGNTELPKQFLKLGTKPIIIHTIEQFLLNERVDKVLVCVSSDWTSYMEDLIKKYINSKNVIVIEGGATRDETVMSGCYYIKENFGLSKEDIIITHDAVRPFITQRIIDENIDALEEYDAVDTCIHTTDTIVEAYHDDSKCIQKVPDRKYLYNGQTPQSFKIERLLQVHDEITKEEKEILTDACKIFILRNEKVKIVEGESFNIKITTMFDLKLANAILIERGNK